MDRHATNVTASPTFTFKGVPRDIVVHMATELVPTLNHGRRQALFALGLVEKSLLQTLMPELVDARLEAARSGILGCLNVVPVDRAAYSQYAKALRYFASERQHLDAQSSLKNFNFFAKYLRHMLVDEREEHYQTIGRQLDEATRKTIQEGVQCPSFVLKLILYEQTRPETSGNVPFSSSLMTALPESSREWVLLAVEANSLAALDVSARTEAGLSLLSKLNSVTNPKVCKDVLFRAVGKLGVCLWQAPVAKQIELIAQTKLDSDTSCDLVSKFLSMQRGYLDHLTPELLGQALPEMVERWLAMCALSRDEGDRASLLAGALEILVGMTSYRPSAQQCAQIIDFCSTTGKADEERVALATSKLVGLIIRWDISDQLLALRKGPRGKLPALGLWWLLSRLAVPMKPCNIPSVDFGLLLRTLLLCEAAFIAPKFHPKNSQPLLRQLAFSIAHAIDQPELPATAAGFMPGASIRELLQFTVQARLQCLQKLPLLALDVLAQDPSFDVGLYAASY